jgi:type 1 glutamine amidotransferase
MMGWHKLTLAVLLLFGSAPLSLADAPKRILLLGQIPDGHPPESHEYMAGMKVLSRCLTKAAPVEVTIVRADDPWPEGPDLLQRADGVVLFLSEGAKWMRHDPRRLDALSKLAARRGGLVGLHWAIGTREAQNIDDCLKLLGGCHGGPDRRYKVVEVEAQIPDPQHPITFGIAPFRVHDEFYYQLKFARRETSIQPVLRVPIEGQAETVAWSWERPDGGRSFGFSGLHFHSNWRLAAYRRLITQGILWSLKLPIPKEGVAVDVTDDDLKLK